MATDIHVGRQAPTFVVQGNPDKFIQLIKQHGTLSRIMRARKCPCGGPSGSPSMYCSICNGDGYVYDFQRKLLQSDEDSDIKADRNIVYPFRIPLLDALSVERMLPKEQGGIKKYTIDKFTDQTIEISGDPLPYHWNAMRVSYYFDRFNKITKEIAKVNAATKTLTLEGAVFDDEYATGNIKGATGDIVIVNRIEDMATGYKYVTYTTRGNQIYLGAGTPDPTPGKIEVDYYYCPAVRVLVADLENRDQKEKWTTGIYSGIVRIAMEPWFNLSEGDLITLLIPDFTKNEIISHNASGIDKLFEFDVTSIDDIILDEKGIKYEKNKDYILRNFRDIIWTGNQPVANIKISVKYLYHPTYVIFQDGMQPNALENKEYPKVVSARLWGKTLDRDVEMLEKPYISMGGSLYAGT